MSKEKKLSLLSPSLLSKNPENPRLIFREEDMDVLMRSISQVGIQVPLSIYQKGKQKKYILIDGERRWRCALKLGLKTVPVIFEPEPSPLNNLLMMFNIHNVRVQWDLMALAVKVSKVKDLFWKENRKLLTKNELADLTGVSTSTITRCEELLSLPKKYQNIIWKELEKPKGEQKYTEDLFIEIKKSIKAIENYIPEIIEDYSTNNLLDIFFKKYESNIVINRVEFRNISKIARGEKVGISKEKVVEAINDFIKNPQESISKVFENSVADAYLERSYEKKIVDVIKVLKELDQDLIEEDVINLLIDLKNLIDTILKNR